MNREIIIDIPVNNYYINVTNGGGGERGMDGTVGAIPLSLFQTPSSSSPTFFPSFSIPLSTIAKYSATSSVISEHFSANKNLTSPLAVVLEADSLSFPHLKWKSSKESPE